MMKTMLHKVYMIYLELKHIIIKTLCYINKMMTSLLKTPKNVIYHTTQ